MLMADGFGPPVLTDFSGKPGAGVFTARFPGESFAPLAEILSEHAFLRTQHVSDADNPHLVEAGFGHFPHARNLADIEWGKKTLLLTGQHIKDTVGLGLIRTNLGHEPRA